MKKELKSSDLTAKFGGKYQPRDDKFIEIYKKVITGEAPIVWALVAREAIKPFSHYKPITSKELKTGYLQEIVKGSLPSIHVYEENGVYVMSDDYNLYYLYLELDWEQIPAKIIGETSAKHTNSLTRLKPPTHLEVALETPGRLWQEELLDGLDDQAREGGELTVDGVGHLFKIALDKKLSWRLRHKAMEFLANAKRSSG